MHFPAVQQLWNSVKIRQSYREFKGGNFFWDTLYILLYFTRTYADQNNMEKNGVGAEINQQTVSK